MLEDELKAAKRFVTTDTLTFSLNEFVSMYETSELNVNPAFQRTFRWGPEQQSNLIESLLIGIPLPPFFIYENEDGSWELIDGLQRTSTILKFLGKLRQVDGHGLEPPSALVATKYMPSLKNVVWQISPEIEGLEVDRQIELPSSLQLFLKRCRITTEVLKQPSDALAKFDLFQRLNRGGSTANQQEIRTCLVVMRAPNYAELFSDLAANPSFRALCQISDDDVKSQKDVEYVTRVICHAYVNLQGREDLNEFLDRAIVEVVETKSPKELHDVFEGVVELVYAAGGESALIPPDASRKVFTLQGLESILVGVARNFHAIKALDDPTGFVRDRIGSLWTSDHAVVTSSGMRAADRLTRTIPIGDNWFRPNV